MSVGQLFRRSRRDDEALSYLRLTIYRLTSCIRIRRFRNFILPRTQMTQPPVCFTGPS